MSSIPPFFSCYFLLGVGGVISFVYVTKASVYVYDLEFPSSFCSSTVKNVHIFLHHSGNSGICSTVVWVLSRHTSIFGV